MSITVGVDTWATVDEADAILAHQIGAAEWFGLRTDAPPGMPSKEAYLVTAYRWVRSVYGMAATDAAPSTLKEAQALAANWLITFREDYEKREALISSGVEDFSWSRWEETLRSNVKPPRFLSDLMAELGAGGANTSVQLYGDDYDL